MIPLFPLRPLYFVFTNAVSTSDTVDIMDLQEITRALSTKVDIGPSFFQIHRLCRSLTEIYTAYASRVKNVQQMDYFHQGILAGTAEDIAPNNDQEPRQYSHIASPPPSIYPDVNGRSRSALNGPPFFEAFENPTNQLLPWDQVYFEQQMDWDLLYNQLVPGDF